MLYKKRLTLVYYSVNNKYHKFGAYYERVFTSLRTKDIKEDAEETDISE